MQNALERSATVIGLECESLEDASWGTGRIIRSLIRELASIPGIERRFHFVCYSNGTLPARIVPDHPAFTARPTGLQTFAAWLPSSFSVYYYVLLPIRLWIDRPALTYFPNYMLPIGAPRRSLVMLTDDIFREVANPDLPLKFRLAYSVFATGWAKRYATAIHAISQASATTLSRLGIDTERMVLNPLGVEAAQSLVSHVPSAFLFVGQAFERRRLRECLHVFERLTEEDASLVFRIIGKDKYREPLIGKLVRDMNGRLGRDAVTWLEYASEHELASAYAGAETLLYVSDSEAFGLPPLEALSYGVPAVVADTPLTREIYGDAAFFVASPFNETAIETAMRAALNDGAHRRYIAERAHDIVARYTWSGHAQRFLKAISSLTA